MALPFKEMKRVISTNPRFFTSVIELDFGDGKARVLPREAQLHPVTDDPLHVDFLRAEACGARVTVEVPVRFLHEDRCPGLRRGGVLNIVRREVELLLPRRRDPGHSSPSTLLASTLATLIHISNTTLPEGVRPTITDRDFTVASIVPPSTEAEPGEGEAEAGAAS